MSIEISSMSPGDIAKRLNEKPVDLVRDAAKEGMTLSAYLERLNPSEKGDPIDAYGRQLREANIVTRSNPEAGYWASEAKVFFDTPAGRALYPEFFARQWRKVSFGGQRAVFLSDDGIAGSWQRPYVEAQSPRWNQMIAPAIPLSEVIAMTSPISGQDYRAIYLTYDAVNLRKFRIGESAEIPIATLDDAERTIRLKKYGRGLRASYEQLRRMRVDKLAYYIQMMAVQSEVDKVSAAIDVLVNGDGNAATVPVTLDLNGDLDSASTPGTMTLKGWIAYKMKFVQPYVLTTALVQEAVALQLALLNTGSANVPLSAANLGGLGTGLTPINQFADGVRYGWTADAPSLKIVGFDRRMALEHVTEIGGDISEMERFITNQTQVMTMTEVNGFAVLDPNAVKILDVND